MTDMNVTACQHYGSLLPLHELEAEFSELEETLRHSRKEAHPLVAVEHVRERLARTRAACENVDNELDVAVAAKLSGRSKATIRRWCDADASLGARRAGQWVVDRDRLLEKIGGPVRLGEQTEEAA